ncbi:hypothetical protein B0G80_7344 [Paraburkholderia sp. BL6669N2]|uniref:hypothetical protein n=1 Tax=Paraburkholderia sp. BL6669N2 TaxID=1938807 RepID=UPI000E392000|nr:hypothetical protein [Paraburkholderia sp. BL6669N2]REG50879.1 hypothetical protein B0G80_7344 [Paraburkholderia sp. BL6669N2]
MFQSISKEAFEARFYGRTPFARLFSSEIEWFSDERDMTTVLAVMLRCEIDKDLNAIVLGRDMDRRFRAIHMIVSKDTREEILEALDACVDNLFESHVDGRFPQGDESTPFAIFDPRIAEHRRNRYYRLLTDDPVHFPARVMMEELAHWFKDPDGIFIRALQGNEFNSRLFELYLHAVFYELEFEISREHPQPDYCLQKGSNQVFIEAVTVAEMEGTAQRELNPETIEEVQRHAAEEMPFKFSRALLNKVRHRPEPNRVHYWELDHVRGGPFVIALHDYSRPLSMAFSSLALQEYLYGVRVTEDGHCENFERHVLGERSIPANFFAHDRHTHIAAVMLATQATIPKFNRMGRLAGLRSPNSLAVVTGTRTDAHGIPRPFHAVVEKRDYTEQWHDGIYVFHNPRAVHPLDHNLFPHVIHVFKTDSGIEQLVPSNFIVSSITNMLITDPSGIDDALRRFDGTDAPLEDSQTTADLDAGTSASSLDEIISSSVA